MFPKKKQSNVRKINLFLFALHYIIPKKPRQNLPKEIMGREKLYILWS